MASQSAQWVRLKVDGGFGLRRGAWYAVSALVGGEVLVHVGHSWARVPWTSLDARDVQPNRWTVVNRPANAVMLPDTWGEHYGVCPRCRHRAPLQSAPQTMHCPRCYGLFAVAWDEAYLGRQSSMQ